jgi:hypothetical protein
LWIRQKSTPPWRRPAAADRWLEDLNRGLVAGAGHRDRDQRGIAEHGRGRLARDRDDLH